MNDEGYYELTKAIILQAVDDFKPAYRRLKKHPDDPEAMSRVEEITEFFCSEYFNLLSEANGPRLLRMIQERIDDKTD